MKMNKLLLAVSAALLVSGTSIATADAGTATGTNGAQDNGHATGAAAAGGTDATAPHRAETASPSTMETTHAKGKRHKRMKTEIKAMDSNHDGMISKEEFMSYHEAKYDHMTKNKNGMVDVSAMGRMHKTHGK
jgi:hypothetical protein